MKRLLLIANKSWEVEPIGNALISPRFSPDRKIVGSVETTHGIIRLASESRFAFVSGITDRTEHFSEDVDGKDKKGNKKTEAQNYACSFNIGIYIAAALPKITQWLK
jgi:hypothetical protein